MAEVMRSALDVLPEIFNQSMALNVLLFAVILAVISLFIWKFYRSTSKMNLIDLNLSKYNRSEHPLASKFFALILYLLEYIIIMPFLITLWFAGLTIVLLVIAKERPLDEILLISAALIGAIRILAYTHSEISKDLAKLFPFITLSVFLLSPGELSLTLIWAKIQEVPRFLDHALSFVLVVFAIEIVLRVFYSIYVFWSSENDGAAIEIKEKEIEKVVKEKVKEELE